jgi:hypothetical protein
MEKESRRVRLPGVQDIMQRGADSLQKFTEEVEQEKAARALLAMAAPQDDTSLHSMLSSPRKQSRRFHLQFLLNDEVKAKLLSMNYEIYGERPWVVFGLPPGWTVEQRSIRHAVWPWSTYPSFILFHKDEQGLPRVYLTVTQSEFGTSTLLSLRII